MMARKLALNENSNRFGLFFRLVTYTFGILGKKTILAILTIQKVTWLSRSRSVVNPESKGQMDRIPCWKKYQLCVRDTQWSKQQ